MNRVKFNNPGNHIRPHKSLAMSGSPSKPGTNPDGRARREKSCAVVAFCHHILQKAKLPHRELQHAEIRLVVCINIYIKIMRKVKSEIRPQRNTVHTTTIILNRRGTTCIFKSYVESEPELLCELDGNILHILEGFERT